MTHLWGREWSRSELLGRVGSLGQVADVTLTEIADGPGKGVRLLQFRNAGLLNFDVALDRASDVGRVEALGRPVAFWSKAGQTAPWRWTHRDDKDGFLRAFAGGLFVTCGLDHISGPEQEPPASDDGSTTGQHYPVHGRVTGTPATLRGYGMKWRGDECILWAETEVRQAGMYSENLVLNRRITTVLGRPTISVQDTITNENFKPSPHMMMYHCNVGFPALDSTTQLSIKPAMFVVDGPDVPYPLPEPDPAWQTTLQQLTVSKEAGHVEAALSSASGTWRLRWNSETMPFLMLWQHFEAGSYVMGVQPSTNRANGRTSAREAGELLVLQPGESVTHDLEFDFSA